MVFIKRASRRRTTEIIIDRFVKNIRNMQPVVFLAHGVIHNPQAWVSRHCWVISSI